MAGAGDWIGPLIFLGIAGYGIYAYTQMKWPFDGSIMLPGLGGGAGGDMGLGGGLPMDMTGLGGGGGGMGVDCMGNPCTCAMEGIVSYDAALEFAKRSKSGKSGSSTLPPSMGMIPPTMATGMGMGMGGLTPYAPALMPSASCPCDCSGGAGGGGMPIDMTGLGAGGGADGSLGAGGAGGGGGGGGSSGKSKKGGHHTKGKGKKHGKKKSGKKKSHYAIYGDYGGSGALISGGVPIQDYTSGFARYGDYGNVGNAISDDADPFRKAYTATYGDYGGVGAQISEEADPYRSGYASYGDYGPTGALISSGVQPADYSAYESVYGPEDAYQPVQYGYSGFYSRPNYRAGFLPQASNRNPLAEIIDRGVPVAIS
jgi:hypothetical protein